MLTSNIQDDADVWETWDPKLNVFLQCNDNDLKQLVVRGKFGLAGLVRFFEHLVRDRKVDEGLLEGKAKRLVDAIDAYVSVNFLVSSNDDLISVAWLILRKTHRSQSLQTSITKTRHRFHLILYPMQTKPHLRLEKAADVHDSLPRLYHQSKCQFVFEFPIMTIL